MSDTTPTPWSVSEHNFPRDGSTAEQLRFLLRYAVLAPSGHNTQPWRFTIAEDQIWVRIDPERALPALDPGGREMVMSCAAVVFHLRIAMHHYGFAPSVRPFPKGREDPCVAAVGFGRRMDATLRQHRLFQAICTRRTHRGAFRDDPVPAVEVERLERSAETEGALLTPLPPGPDREAFADLVLQADSRMADDPDVRREWAKWASTGGAGDRPDGIPGAARGWNALRTHAAPFLAQLPGGYVAAQDTRDRITQAPLVAVLSTLSDSRRDWFDAGQALCRILLQGRTYGLYASFLNHPLKVPDLRLRVARLAGIQQSPQAVLRIGFAADFDEPTPRRSVEAVLDDPPEGTGEEAP